MLFVEDEGCTDIIQINTNKVVVGVFTSETTCLQCSSLSEVIQILQTLVATDRGASNDTGPLLALSPVEMKRPHSPHT